LLGKAASNAIIKNIMLCSVYEKCPTTEQKSGTKCQAGKNISKALSM
jgi:hypothetical protein